MIFTTGADTVAGRNVRRDGWVMISVDDPVPPFSFVLSRAAAASEDLAELLAVATRLGGRYMGAGRAAEYGARNAVPGELVVRVSPARVLAERGIAD